jgi:hypothetical protein
VPSPLKEKECSLTDLKNWLNNELLGFFLYALLLISHSNGAIIGVEEFSNVEAGWFPKYLYRTKQRKEP